VVYFGGLVVHFQDTGRSFAGLFKGRFEELLVNVDAMEVVIVLSLSVSVSKLNRSLAYSAEFGLVIAQWVCALHFTIGPVMHDQLLENDLFLR
jgi:hypothetical protein